MGNVGFESYRLIDRHQHLHLMRMEGMSKILINPDLSESRYVTSFHFVCVFRATRRKDFKAVRRVVVERSIGVNGGVIAP